MESSKPTFIGSSCLAFYLLDVENSLQINHTSLSDNTAFSSPEGSRPWTALITQGGLGLPSPVRQAAFCEGPREGFVCLVLLTLLHQGRQLERQMAGSPSV